MEHQSVIDQANAAFWDELCGSYNARQLGVTGNDLASLKRYDDWFFSFYPYLAGYIDFETIRGKEVLEVGLGYGSVSQRLAESGAKYTGLDIAKGPVDAVNHRLRNIGAPGKAVQGSILRAPFPDRSFDEVITIGCLHHTGNIALGISEVARVLRPGGRAVIMVYNSMSYLRILKHPLETAKQLMSGAVRIDDGNQRRDFDRNAKDEAAPETAVVSKRQLGALLKRNFGSFEIRRENIASHKAIQRIPRETMCRIFGPTLGLDLYATAIKANTG